MRQKPKAGSRAQSAVPVILAIAILAVIAVNVALILRLSRTQSDALGNTQLDVIRSDLEDTITAAETDVLRVAMGAEQLMEAGASQEALTEYFYAQRDKYQSVASFKNVYIANPDWLIVPIIALTANAFEEDVKQCLEAGMNAHLAKPVDMDLLKETLAGLLPPQKP